VPWRGPVSAQPPTCPQSTAFLSGTALRGSRRGPRRRGARLSPSRGGAVGAAVSSAPAPERCARVWAGASGAGGSPEREDIAETNNETLALKGEEENKSLGQGGGLEEKVPVHSCGKTSADFPGASGSLLSRWREAVSSPRVFGTQTQAVWAQGRRLRSQRGSS